MGALFRVRLAARAGRKEAGARGFCQGNRPHDLFFRQEFSRNSSPPSKSSSALPSDILIINFIKPLFSTIFELSPDSWVIFSE
jgi:hypothetical protein